MLYPSRILTLIFGVCALLTACGEDAEDAGARDVLVGMMGPAGGELVGERGTALEGVTLSVPEGSLTEDVRVEVQQVQDDTPLPENAFSIGEQFGVSSDGSLGASARLTVPFDPEQLRQLIDDIEGVKVWRRADEGWVTAEVLLRQDARVTVALDTPSTYGPGVRLDE